MPKSVCIIHTFFFKKKERPERANIEWGKRNTAAPISVLGPTRNDAVSWTNLFLVLELQERLVAKQNLGCM